MTKLTTSIVEELKKRVLSASILKKIEVETVEGKKCNLDEFDNKHNQLNSIVSNFHIKVETDIIPELLFGGSQLGSKLTLPNGVVFSVYQHLDADRLKWMTGRDKGLAGTLIPCLTRFLGWDKKNDNGEIIPAATILSMGGRTYVQISLEKGPIETGLEFKPDLITGDIQFYESPGVIREAVFSNTVLSITFNNWLKDTGVIIPLYLVQTSTVLTSSGSIVHTMHDGSRIVVPTKLLKQRLTSCKKMKLINFI